VPRPSLGGGKEARGPRGRSLFLRLVFAAGAVARAPGAGAAHPGGIGN